MIFNLETNYKLFAIQIETFENLCHVVKYMCKKINDNIMETMVPGMSYSHIDIMTTFSVMESPS